MVESIDDLERRVAELEHRIESLRTQVRHAVRAGDGRRATRLRLDLRHAENDWESTLGRLGDEVETPTRPTAPGTSTGILPLREQVHQVLTLVGVPTAAKTVVLVHEALFSGEMVPARLTSLRRDEERSFRLAPFARPFYICSALSADRLAPLRGLLAVSTWPMEVRAVGPLSARVDFLHTTINIAAHIARVNDSTTAARRLLHRFAVNIPGAVGFATDLDPEKVVAAAKAELSVHEEADRRTRETAGEHACELLDDVARLFGSRLGSRRPAAADRAADAAANRSTPPY